MNDDIFPLAGGRASAASAPPQPSPAVKPFTPPPAEPAAQLTEADLEADGSRLAQDMTEKGYQPVIFVGNANSGKTSVLLSLISLLKLRPDLRTSAFLDAPLLDPETPFGSYQREKAVTFFNRNVQDFIDGHIIAKTNVQVPFFVPVSVRPAAGIPLTFAFMESNGEWFKPNKTDNALFPRLRRNIEEFISSYQGGIIFIYALPYTQQTLWSNSANAAQDSNAIQECDLAVAGALQSYERIRYDKTHDKHLFLITKWDGHGVGSDVATALSQTSHGHVSTFAADHYPQSMALLSGFGAAAADIKLQHYCSGIMNAQGPQQLKSSNPLSAVVLRYPERLWDYLYRQALVNAGRLPASPFPQPPPRPFWKKLLDVVAP